MPASASKAACLHHRPVGGAGSGKGHGGCYITHWFRPTPYAFEDCKAVGSGSVADCIAALDRYVASYPKAMTNEEVGMTLGVIRPYGSVTRSPPNDPASSSNGKRESGREAPA